MEDTWLPRKIDPMLRNSSAGGAAFRHRGPINNWPEIDHSGH